MNQKEASKSNIYWNTKTSHYKWKYGWWQLLIVNAWCGPKPNWPRQNKYHYNLIKLSNVSILLMYTFTGNTLTNYFLTVFSVAGAINLSTVDCISTSVTSTVSCWTNCLLSIVNWTVNPTVNHHLLPVCMYACYMSLNCSLIYQLVTVCMYVCFMCIYNY